jgi:hypothetical protein
VISDLPARFTTNEQRPSSAANLDRTLGVPEREHVEPEHHEHAIRELEPGQGDLVERARNVQDDDVARSPRRGDRCAVRRSPGRREPLPVSGRQEGGEPRRMPPGDLVDVLGCHLVAQRDQIGDGPRLLVGGTPIAAEASAKTTSRSTRMQRRSRLANAPARCVATNVAPAPPRAA